MLLISASWRDRSSCSELIIDSLKRNGTFATSPENPYEPLNSRSRLTRQCFVHSKSILVPLSLSIRVSPFYSREIITNSFAPYQSDAVEHSKQWGQRQQQRPRASERRFGPNLSSPVCSEFVPFRLAPSRPTAKKKNEEMNISVERQHKPTAKVP